MSVLGLKSNDTEFRSEDNYSFKSQNHYDINDINSL